MTVGQVTCVLGSQWGDEGKGKLVDLLAGNCDIVARCQGGSNAGHTIVVENNTFHFHLLPCGLMHPRTLALIGNGCVIHLQSLFKEIKDLELKGINVEDRLFISDRAHIVFNYHQIADGLKEDVLGRNSLGTTRRGIGPAYSDKASRVGLRLHQLFHWDDFQASYMNNLANIKKVCGDFEYDIENELSLIKSVYIPWLTTHVVDASFWLQQKIKESSRVLVEGANAIMIDVDAGTYPFVTSSHCTIGGVFTGLSLAPRYINEIIGVVKAYTTRVGHGPFPTELLNSIGDQICDHGKEFGTTTGRRRRCGWLDLVLLEYSTRINGYTCLNLTKLDVLTFLDEIQVAVAYVYKGEYLLSFPADLSILNDSDFHVEYKTFPGWKRPIDKCRNWSDLPKQAQQYIQFIEAYLHVPIRWVGVGPSRDAMIEK